MRTVPLSEAKNNLSRYVAEVRAGRRVRVAVRGRPVVELVRIEELDLRDEWDRGVEELVRRGVVRGPRVRPESSKELSRPGPRVKGTPVSETLIEDRRSGR